MLEESRLAGLDLDQVFLAVCTTGVVGVDTDEMMSLATTFLAAGVHTVLGALWSIPAGETSLLMYMVHHFLAEGSAPVDALHAAQLWMPDPRRIRPAGMPPELSEFAGWSSTADPAKTWSLHGAPLIN